MIFPNGTEPTLGANTAGFYAADVAGTTEAFAVDEAGNQVQLTQHDETTGEAIHRSSNSYSGRELVVFIEQLALEVERLSGKRFVFETWRPKENRLDWNAVQEAQRILRDQEIADWVDGVSLGSKPTPYVAKVMPPYIEAALGHA